MNDEEKFIGKKQTEKLPQSNVSGFFLLDKPLELNSFAIVKILRRLLNMKRIGYAGTLDPLATGLMIVALGESTKLLHYLEKLDKTYEVSASFGVVSETYDAEGPLYETNFKGEISKALIKETLTQNFLGLCNQKPPMYSAIKVDGKRAYSLARKGIEIDLKLRAVTFFSIEITSFAWPEISMTVHCSSGTYIRSIVHDLGQILGCGAYVTKLRRTKVGIYSIENAFPLYDLTKENSKIHLLSALDVFKDSSKIFLDETEYNLLARGGFIDNAKSFDHYPILAVHASKCVGVLETISEGKQLKFLKKFNIV